MAKTLATEHDLETLLSDFLFCLIETSVASLNEGLVEACKHLGNSGNGPRYLLDVKLTDDNEVANRLGYGALVHSVYVRPTEIWSR